MSSSRPRPDRDVVRRSERARTEDEIRYRRARPDDALALQANVNAGFETYREFAPPGWDPPDQTGGELLARARAELEDPETFALLAEVGGALAGHVMLVAAKEPSTDGWQPDQHLRHLFVLAPYWGTGIARTLHARMLEHVRGTARLYTPALQARARRFYEREGWTLRRGPFEAPGLGMQLVEYRLKRPRSGDVLT